MSYSIHIKESSIGYPEYFKESDTPLKIHVLKEKRKIRHREINLLPNDEKLGSAKGITYALILCVPFWILIIMLFVWAI